MALMACLGAACLTGCAHKRVQAKAAASVDDSYLDLIAGGRLRILVPLLTSGRYVPAAQAESADGNTKVFAAKDLIGYQVSYYSIEGRGKGKVRLKFASAEVTKNSKTVQEQKAPALPFGLPTKREYVRLIYLIRSSRSDHNMAIAAANKIEELEGFTRDLRSDPAVCERSGAVFCSWVPVGIAVRPEPAGAAN